MLLPRVPPAYLSYLSLDLPVILVRTFSIIHRRTAERYSVPSCSHLSIVSYERPVRRYVAVQETSGAVRRGLGWSITIVVPLFQSRLKPEKYRYHPASHSGPL
jgi:hypothetical protein